MGSMAFFITSARIQGEILAFRGTLARAEENKNGDDLDGDEIQAIARTLPHTAITLQHEPHIIVGHWTDAKVASEAVEAEGMLYAGRYPQVAEGVMQNRYELSVEAKAELAICKVCGQEFANPTLYCEHLVEGRDTGIYPTGRKLKHCQAVGGALVDRGAGTNTRIDPMSIRMVASDLTRQDLVLPSVEQVIQWLMQGEYISQQERESMDEADFAGPHHSFPIRNQQDVYDAARLIGHADDPEAVKAAIIRIAKRKGFKLPDSWQNDSADRDKVRAKGGAAMLIKCSRCGRELEAEALEAHIREEEATERHRLEASLQAKEELLSSVKAKDEELLASAKARDEELQASVTAKDQDLARTQQELDGLREQVGMQRIAARLVELSPVLGAALDEDQKKAYARLDDGAFSVVLAALKEKNAGNGAAKPANTMKSSFQKVPPSPTDGEDGEHSWEGLF